MTAHRLIDMHGVCAATGKRAYTTLEQAERALDTKQRAGLPVTRAYRCDCGAWHLTCEGMPAQRRAR